MRNETYFAICHWLYGDSQSNVNCISIYTYHFIEVFSIISLYISQTGFYYINTLKNHASTQTTKGQNIHNTVRNTETSQNTLAFKCCTEMYI